MSEIATTAARTPKFLCPHPEDPHTLPSWNYIGPQNHRKDGLSLPNGGVYGPSGSKVYRALSRNPYGTLKGALKETLTLRL